MNEKMTVIINIQAMRKVAGLEETPFEVLEQQSIEYLREMQDDLIPLYNKAVKK